MLAGETLTGAFSKHCAALAQHISTSFFRDVQRNEKYLILLICLLLEKAKIASFSAIFDGFDLCDETKYGV